MLDLTIITNILAITHNIIIHNPIIYGVIKGIMILAFVVWGIFSAYHVLGLIASKMYKPSSSNKKIDAEIVIVSVANNKVRDSLMESMNHNSKYGSITLLIDEDSELIDELRDVYNTIVVPKWYRNDLIGKGRALNYFAENVARDDKWYIFFDDDNLLLDDYIFYEISEYDKRGYVAANPILIPRQGNSKMAYIMDWVRYFDDLLVFRFFTGLLGKPLIGMHGEMFTVKGSVLREIGYKHKTLTEDFRFACELVKKGYKTWQSRSRVSILSPNSIKDLSRQRGRWFNGLINDLSSTRLYMQIIVLIRLVAWIIGVFGSWAFAPLWIYFDPFYYSIVGGIIYWYIYIYGVKRLGDYKYLVLIPIYGILESFSWIKGIRCKEYVVINKNRVSLSIK